MFARFAPAAALLLASPAAAQIGAGSDRVTSPPDLTFERVFASPALDGATPREAKLSPDGRYLAVLRAREDERERHDLWVFERETGDWRMLVDSEALGSGRALSEDERMQRERARIGDFVGIVSYQWTPSGNGVLVPLDGDLYLATLDGDVRRLTDTEAGELNPKISEAGGYLSFVRDRRLWIGPVGGEARPVTPAEGEAIRWAEAEFIAQEEMARTEGYWWSPDDRRIAVQRTDESGVGIVTRAAIGATGTEVFDQRYPVAGSANAVVELFVMDPDGGDRVKADLGPETDIYLARVDWAPDGSVLYVQRQDREQTVLDMLRVDPATGSSEVLFTERAARPDYWLNLSDAYRWLDDGSLIWWSERDGFGHLYRFADGGWTQLTDGDWVVTDLVGVNETAGRLFFVGTKDGVLEQHVYALDLAGGEPFRLTEAGFTYGAKMDEAGDTLLVTREAPDQAPQTYLASAEGERLAWVEQNALDANHPYAPFLPSHAMPEYGTVAAEDGTPLHWMMIKPRDGAGQALPRVLLPLWRAGAAGGRSRLDRCVGAGHRRSRLHLVRARQSRQRQSRRRFRAAALPRDGRCRGARPTHRGGISKGAALRRSG